MATYSSILAWKIPWTEEPGEECKELDVTKQVSTAHAAWAVLLGSPDLIISRCFFTQPQEESSNLLLRG